jgi:hypothetical protein
MHTARGWHAAVCHSQYLYVLAGYNDDYLKECERYVCAESRWEVLPALPVAGCAMSAVVLSNSLYAIGGWEDVCLDTVQKLSLDSHNWELIQLKLPQAVRGFQDRLSSVPSDQGDPVLLHSHRIQANKDSSSKYCV